MAHKHFIIKTNLNNIKKIIVLLLLSIASLSYGQSHFNLIGYSKNEIDHKMKDLHCVFESEKPFGQNKIIIYKDLKIPIGYAYILDNNKKCIMVNVLTKNKDRIYMDNFTKALSNDCEQIQLDKWTEKKDSNLYEWYLREDAFVIILEVKPLS